MRDLILVDGDICNTMFGDIALSSGDDEIIQTACNNIQTIYGENRLHKNIGNKAYKRRLKITQSNLVIVANDCKNAILQDHRVANASVTATATDGSTECSVFFKLTTTSGKILSSTVNIMR